MSSPEWMNAPSGRCLVCGNELGAEPHFIVEPPDGEHVRCRDWSAHPWPYERLERTVQSRLRALRVAIAAIDDLGGFVKRSRWMWPDGIVAEVIEARVRVIRDLLERAGWRSEPS